MRLITANQGWTVEHDGTVPIPIGGIDYFETRQDLVDAIERRGGYVWASDDIRREPELSADEVAERDAQWDAAEPPKPPAPPTQDPPIDPSAQPDNPSPVSPEPEKASPSTKAKKKVVDADAQPKRRGRPPLYSPDEAAERRREQAKTYHSNRSEKQKEDARKRAAEWRAKNPDKVKNARKASIETRAKRYKEDPQFRDSFNSYQRDYKRDKRSETAESI